jgi:hypothetical protein
LIEKLPDDGELYAYEGEDTGIVISKDNKNWFIRADETLDENYETVENTYTEGFETEEEK